MTGGRGVVTNEALEERAVNVVRALAMDAVQRANSGHPGTPMALAPLVDVLFTRVMNYDATDLDWPDRDRFVLSAGHASMLIYSMLYLCGLGLELEDLRQFRQWGRRRRATPRRATRRASRSRPGPLGQGIGNAVGIALAEQHLRARFGAELCNHYTFAICSDGDFMEGISHEAASFAGHYQLGHLVAVYDDNHITIDGATELTYTDNVPERFRAYGWDVRELGEVSEDLDALERALRDGMAVEDRPTLLVLRSHIGYPSPKFQDTSKAHGEPLGADEVARVKEILGPPARSGLLRPRRRARVLPRRRPPGRVGARRVGGAPPHGRGRESRSGPRSSTSRSRAAASRAGSRSCPRGQPGDVARDAASPRKRC